NRYVDFSHPQKNTMHRDEVLELEKSRHLVVKGNTGGWRPLRADEDSMEWKKEPVFDEPETLSPQVEIASRFYDEGESPTEMAWDGESFQLPGDRPEFFACQIDTRGSWFITGRNKTDEELDAERAERARKWRETQPLSQAIIKSGVCNPTSQTKPED